MRVSLHVLLVAPEEELLRADETYAEITVEMELPFVPFPGLCIHLVSPILEDDPRAAEFSRLWQAADSLDGVFDIERVIYYPDEDRFELRAHGRRYRSLESFRAAIEGFALGYGFERTA